MASVELRRVGDDPDLLGGHRRVGDDQDEGGEEDEQTRHRTASGPVIVRDRGARPDQALVQALPVDWVVLEIGSLARGDDGADRQADEGRGNDDGQADQVADPQRLESDDEGDHGRRDGRGGDSHLRGDDRDGQRTGRADPVLLRHVDDDGDDRVGGVSGTAHDGHEEGDEGRQEDDLPGVLAQQELSEVNEVVHGAGHLERGDGADDGHDDADDIPGHVLTRGGHAGDGQDDDAGRSRQADADAAEPGADDNEQ